MTLGRNTHKTFTKHTSFTSNAPSEHAFTTPATTAPPHHPSVHFLCPPSPRFLRKHPHSLLVSCTTLFYLTVELMFTTKGLKGRNTSFVFSCVWFNPVQSNQYVCDLLTFSSQSVLLQGLFPDPTAFVFRPLCVFTSPTVNMFLDLKVQCAVFFFFGDIWWQKWRFQVHILLSLLEHVSSYGSPGGTCCCL